MLGGAIQDSGGFCHFDHEGRATAGEVVSGADARKDAIYRPDHCARCRHETARISEQGDQRNLPHEGRFTAHVRAGDQQQFAVAPKCAVVGDEPLDLVLDHRMTTLLNENGRFVDQMRRAPVVAHRMIGEGNQDIQLGDGVGNFLQPADMRRELVQQLFIEEFLPRQRALLCGQCLVLECLEFGSDVAFCVLQRLAAAVIFRNFISLAVRDFDIETVNLVVLDPKVGNAGACALARFEVQQELARVLR